MLSRARLTLNANSKRPVHINLRITRQRRVRLEYRIPETNSPFIGPRCVTILARVKIHSHERVIS